MEVYQEGITKRLTWKSEDKGDVNRALEFFMTLTRQGWLAVKKNGEYKRVLEFKPEYGELYFMPIVQGG
jgi:hypothetical protein